MQHTCGALLCNFSARGHAACLRQAKQRAHFLACQPGRRGDARVIQAIPQFRVFCCNADASDLCCYLQLASPHATFHAQLGDRRQSVRQSANVALVRRGAGARNLASGLHHLNINIAM